MWFVVFVGPYFSYTDSGETPEEAFQNLCAYVYEDIHEMLTLDDVEFYNGGQPLRMGMILAE